MAFEERYDFPAALRRHGIDLRPLRVATLQVNITKLCNQACRHCHVDASPARTEEMDERAMLRCLEILRENADIGTLDITGGAPELHPRFAFFVEQAKGMGKHVSVRHNLTVTLDPHPRTGEDMRYLPAFFADHAVEVISSLPYYQPYFTDKQRGKGVFEKSIASLKLLNDAGYGKEGTGLTLNLVYNPVGAFLPAAQETLERDFKAELFRAHGIVFNRLFTMINMPIHRFGEQLQRLGAYDEYMEKLSGAFNPAAAEGVMCRSLISVGYDGTIFDCDFNQMLELPVQFNGTREAMTVFNFDLQRLHERRIVAGPHCFGCTAGAGSSCGGATAEG